MHKAGTQALNLRGDCRQAGQELLNTEIESSRAADWGWSANVRFYVSLGAVLYTIPL